MQGAELNDVINIIRHFEWQKVAMGKSCCAVGCTNRYAKGSQIHFYRFPEGVEKRARWVAAVGRKNWVPTKYSWLCSAHFISGEKSNDPLSPDYVPSVFAHTRSPLKRKLVKDMDRFERASAVKKRRMENSNRLTAAESLLHLSTVGNGTEYCEPSTGTSAMTDLSEAFTLQAGCNKGE